MTDPSQQGAGSAARSPAGVFAVVVWFHPSAQDARNLCSYETFVDGIVVVDNSPSSNADLLPRDSKISYFQDGRNKGLGSALNIGCRHAVGQGARWILTMDQDSAFEPADLRRLLAVTREVGDDVAILGPNWRGTGAGAPASVDCDFLITSGSLVRASAFLAIGGYNEDLFIDEVDHEFGFRMRRAGYRLLQLQDVSMRHQLGEPLTRRVLGREVQSSNHQPLRKYYMTRSRLYMRKNYPEFRFPYLRRIVTDAVKVVLVEERKALKLFYMLRGAVDHFRGVKGPLPGKARP